MGRGARDILAPHENRCRGGGKRKMEICKYIHENRAFCVHAAEHAAMRWAIHRVEKIPLHSSPTRLGKKIKQTKKNEPGEKKKEETRAGGSKPLPKAPLRVSSLPPLLSSLFCFSFFSRRGDDWKENDSGCSQDTTPIPHSLCHYFSASRLLLYVVHGCQHVGRAMHAKILTSFSSFIFHFSHLSFCLGCCSAFKKKTKIATAPKHTYHHQMRN